MQPTDQTVLLDRRDYHFARKKVERVRAVEVEEAGINDCARSMTCEDEERAGAGSAP